MFSVFQLYSYRIVATRRVVDALFFFWAIVSKSQTMIQRGFNEDSMMIQWWFNDDDADGGGSGGGGGDDDYMIDSSIAETLFGGRLQLCLEIEI